MLSLLLDLKSAAFNTVDRKCFPNQLEHEFGVTGSTRMWLESYFRDRYQSVYINTSSSARVPIMTGFLQGSAIGPFGFKPYTKCLTAIARKHGLSIYLYPDGTQLCIAFDPEDSEPAVV